MSFQVCRDTSDAVALYLPQRLYLKPYAKLNISVQLPVHKVHGKSISNWELMEKIRKMILPDSFCYLKVSKHSSEVIRFDAELENRTKLDRVLSRLEGRIVQLNDYPDPLKIKVSEAKCDHPSRHSWDSFFRDATDMDEMKPGERPDTIYIRNLPIRWFVHVQNRDDTAPPSEGIFKKVFEKFGPIRQVDIPLADPFRMQMKESIRGIQVSPEHAPLLFEGYIQYSEYVSFVRCMDALRGRKLLRKSEDIAEWCSIHVDFDKTKHMTDAAVKRRAIVRERLAARRRALEDEERQENERKTKQEAREREQQQQNEIEKLAKMRAREERRKKKELAKLMERDNVDLAKSIAEEEKRLLKVQKALQGARVLDEVYKRIELRVDLQRGSNGTHRGRDGAGKAARAGLVDAFIHKQEIAVDEQRERLREARDGGIIIRSALETKRPRRESSVSSLSSDDTHQKKINVKMEKLTTPEREMEYSRSAGVYAAPGPYPYPFPYAACAPYAFPPQTALYYNGRGAYPAAYAVADTYAPRRPYRGRGRGRGRGPRMPYFDGPDASQQYYQYFKKLTATRGEHDDRGRSRSRSRSRSRRRSYTRSRSRRRSYTRSRSRSRSRSRARSRRSHSRRTSRSRTRSRSRRRSRSRSKSRSSRRRSRSKSKRTRTSSRSKSRVRTPSPKRAEEGAGPQPLPVPVQPSRSWSISKDEDRRSWSKSPKNEL